MSEDRPTLDQALLDLLREGIESRMRVEARLEQLSAAAARLESRVDVLAATVGQAEQHLAGIHAAETSQATATVLEAEAAKKRADAHASDRARRQQTTTELLKAVLPYVLPAVGVALMAGAVWLQMQLGVQLDTLSRAPQPPPITAAPEPTP